MISLSSLSTFATKSNVQFRHEQHNPTTQLPPPASTSKDVCPHPQCSEIPFPHDPHCLVMERDFDLEIEQRLLRPFAKNLRRPSSLEVKKYLRLAKGCPQNCVSEAWMKNMMNWDLYTHPRSEEFANATTLDQKISLSMEWKSFMDKHHIYLSFYEWYYTRLTLTTALKPISALLIACPVQTLSVSDLGREIQKIKETQRQEDKKKKDEENYPVKHQQYHILVDI